ncbi:hypothetical protein TTHERM_00979810 (macronuclear) [Tetrahymena thermophila SB210]|uniref:Uncharacterized protein n=1 Tax=Tetrahymena thermophila (strain SB210) TaxID=312017 RepID=Q23JH6_TETTS|nr:hypothetical protein TTHERM_00979810 [Tetrahymena thermophila SB210]EAR96668.2 hypothetical protein TTHERM_00979810 [Tetrahymena thermophila SB210]|eukprot:XP_001016913.2 hypothetical protein TTHERM_00979810 [Tetrahymena thermophila SB210]
MLQNQFLYLQEELMSTLPQVKEKGKCPARQKNLRLITGKHPQHLAQRNTNSQVDSEGFNPPPVLNQKTILKQRNLLNSLSKDELTINNIASSASTDETYTTPIANDDMGESCLSDKVQPINEDDVLEARIHKWLDEQHIYITDPRDKRDKYYQKLKTISCKISQIQSSIYLLGEDEKTNATISENIFSSNNLTNLTCLTNSTIPNMATYHDISMNLSLKKIENSPLLLRRGNKDKKGEKDEQVPVTLKSMNNCYLVKSPTNKKQTKNPSIFRASEPNIKKETTIQNIDTVAFTFNELEENEKKNSGSIQELSQLSIDMHDSVTIVSDSIFNQKI